MGTTNQNDLLNRYLQAVGQFLPSGTRADTIAELRANLLEQMDARAEELGHVLRETEAAAILREHGRPEVVAARYLPQSSLIGPTLFPVYLFALRRALPLVVLVYAVVRCLGLIAAPLAEFQAAGVMSQIIEAVLHLVPTLLFFWGTVTMVFALIEFLQGHLPEGSKWSPGKVWDPAKLPPVKGGPGRARSLTSRVADLVIHCLWMAYCFAVPSHPFLLIGAGAHYLSALHVGLAPAWRNYFVLLIVLLLAQLAIKVVALARQDSPLLAPMKLMTGLLATTAAGYMAFAGAFFTATSAEANLATLAAVNHGMTVAFRIALFFAVLGLLTDSWKSIKRFIPTERLAF